MKYLFGRGWKWGWKWGWGKVIHEQNNSTWTLNPSFAAWNLWNTILDTASNFQSIFISIEGNNWNTNKENCCNWKIYLCIIYMRTTTKSVLSKNNGIFRNTYTSYKLLLLSGTLVIYFNSRKTWSTKIAPLLFTQTDNTPSGVQEFYKSVSAECPSDAECIHSFSSATKCWRMRIVVGVIKGRKRRKGLRSSKWMS